MEDARGNFIIIERSKYISDNVILIIYWLDFLAVFRALQSAYVYYKRGKKLVHALTLGLLIWTTIFMCYNTISLHATHIEIFCQINSWFVIISLSTSNAIVITILGLRAYYALNRKRIVAVGFTIYVICNVLLLMWRMIRHRNIRLVRGYCHAAPKVFYEITNASVNITGYTIFSIIFIYVLWKAKRRFASHTYTLLIRDGTIFVICICLTTVISLSIVISGAAGIYGGLVSITVWSITCVLLVACMRPHEITETGEGENEEFRRAERELEDIPSATSSQLERENRQRQQPNTDTNMTKNGGETQDHDANMLIPSEPTSSKNNGRTMTKITSMIDNEQEMSSRSTDSADMSSVKRGKRPAKE